jgi:hypothetical protein
MRSLSVCRYDQQLQGKLELIYRFWRRSFGPIPHGLAGQAKTPELLFPDNEPNRYRSATEILAAGYALCGEMLLITHMDKLAATP